MLSNKREDHSGSFVKTIQFQIAGPIDEMSLVHDPWKLMERVMAGSAVLLICAAFVSLSASSVNVRELTHYTIAPRVPLIVKAPAYVGI
jgi:hypothetical protein